VTGLSHGSVEPKPASAAARSPALGELESINIRLQAIMADMWALQQQLKQRGALDEAWQPPSLDVQLPAPDTTAPAEPAITPEPIEDPAVLAARLEELTPMQVSVHAPPVIEAAPAEPAAEAAPPPEPDAPSNIAAQDSIAEPPAAKPRKRRAPATAEAEQAIAETPANGTAQSKPRKRRAPATAEASQAIAEVPTDGAPAAKTRKRRTASPSIPRDSAAPADETELVTTEKAPDVNY
jgi:ribonuclease E